MSTAVSLEMSFTSYEQSCRDPHIDPTGDLRECRRPKGHPTDFHASDFPYTEWSTR